MKSNRSFWTPAAVAASAVIAGALLWAGGTPPASAVVATLASASTTQVSGTVIGPPESVAFSGSLTINSKRVSDPDFFTPDIVVVSIDLSSMKGTGLSSGKTYVVTNQEIVIRPLSAGDNVVVTFPFVVNGSPGVSMSPRMGAANLALSFDVATGALTAARATVSNP